MTTNKFQLRVLAEKATPGPWWVDSHGHRMTDNGANTVFLTSEKMGEATRHPETGNQSHWPNDWDASYIAAANPATILALLDEIEALQGVTPELPPMPPAGEGLPRYSIRWNGPTQPLTVSGADGYWTPWHLAHAECERLREGAAEQERKPMPSVHELIAQLDRWQSRVEPLHTCMEAMQNLTGGVEGPLFDAIYAVIGDYTRITAEQVGAPLDLMEDWWLAHRFGAEPMVVRIGGQKRIINTHRRLAWLILRCGVNE